MNENFYNFFIKFWACRKVARSIEGNITLPGIQPSADPIMLGSCPQVSPARWKGTRICGFLVPVIVYSQWGMKAYPGAVWRPSRVLKAAPPAADGQVTGAHSLTEDVFCVSSSVFSLADWNCLAEYSCCWITQDSHSLSVPSLRGLQLSISSFCESSTVNTTEYILGLDSRWGHTYGYPQSVEHAQPGAAWLVLSRLAWPPPREI